MIYLDNNATTRIAPKRSAILDETPHGRHALHYSNNQTKN
jgi:cysteine sulfinate desulfinase/cysteine desulfurase-like protein